MKKNCSKLRVKTLFEKYHQMCTLIMDKAFQSLIYAVPIHIFFYFYCKPGRLHTLNHAAENILSFIIYTQNYYLLFFVVPAFLYLLYIENLLYTEESIDILTAFSFGTLLILRMLTHIFTIYLGNNLKFFIETCDLKYEYFSNSFYNKLC